MNGVFLRKKKTQTPRHGGSDKIFCLIVAFGQVQPVEAQAFVFFLCLIPSLLYVPFQ